MASQQELETARMLGELKSEVARNRADTEGLRDSMKKQNDSIQQLELSIHQLKGIVERLAESLSNQVTDRQNFQREIKEDIARLDGEIKQEIELLKEDLQARRAVTGFISTIVKLWPFITAVGAGVIYYGYVVITGEQPPAGKP